MKRHETTKQKIMRSKVIKKKQDREKHCMSLTVPGCALVKCDGEHTACIETL